MKRITKFINKVFPDISGRIWVDLWSGVALARFAMGLSIDAAALGVVLGCYVVHKGMQQTSSNSEAKGE